MIKVKLKTAAQRLGKSITDIAKETGLNRNTITALFHNKVDGIKFETLEKLNQTYKLKLEDLLEMETSEETTPQAIYTQEGEIIPFTGWKGFLALDSMPTELFGESFGTAYCYFKDDYVIGYWNKSAMYKVAEYIYNRYKEPVKLKKLFNLFLDHANHLEGFYHHCNPAMLLNIDDDELITYLQQVVKAYEKFWQHSIFIDGFDSGYDFQKISEIGEKNKFSSEEIRILTTPKDLTFSNERILMLLAIAKKIARKKINPEMLDRFLNNMIETDPQIRMYRQAFDFYKSNYAHVEHITDQEIKADLKKYLLDKQLLEIEYTRLKNYTVCQDRAIRRVLSKHRLKENPLFFFNWLTYWREYRKKINLMGFQVLEAILLSVETKTGISRSYLKYLSYEEVENALRGLIGLQVLKDRRENGMAVIFEKGRYKILLGTEASSLKEELDQKFKAENQNQLDQTIIPGQVASQGYAKGIARIILDKKDFTKFHEGEILVSGMTRPEFLPLMKMASGIVTNEGGITCHAAIVSRELGKPCVIGTQHATELIKDGDLVEVRANHGTVRILKLAASIVENNS